MCKLFFSPLVTGGKFPQEEVSITCMFNDNLCNLNCWLARKQGHSSRIQPTIRNKWLLHALKKSHAHFVQCTIPRTVLKSQSLIILPTAHCQKFRFYVSCPYTHVEADSCIALQVYFCCAAACLNIATQSTQTKKQTDEGFIMSYLVVLTDANIHPLSPKSRCGNWPTEECPTW